MLSKSIANSALGCSNLHINNAWLPNSVIPTSHINYSWTYRSVTKAQGSIAVIGLICLIDERLIVELKCVEQLQKIHEAQILTYMRLAKIRVGLLINFNVPLLKKGIKRFLLT